MLPNRLCGISQCLRASLLRRKRTPNLPKHKLWMLPQGLEMRMDILQQCGKGGPLMVMGNLTSRPAPEPLDPVGVGIIGWRVNDPQVVMQLGEHLAYQLRARQRMGPQVVYDYKCHAAAGARPGDGRPHLGTKDIGGASWGQAAVKPARTPIDEAEAVDLIVGAGSLDQPLSAPAFPAPDSREGRMKRKLNLILEIKIGARQERQQFFQVWRYFRQEIGIDESGNGWRRRRTGPGQDYLHPQTFPT